MSAGAVKAGGVFVEIGADPRKFFSALSKVNKSLGSMGQSLASGGGRLAAAGIGMAAPIAAAVRQGAAFESTLLNIRASTGATSGEIDKIKASAMQMSQALGVGPTEAAGGMLELLKAGMSLDSVLGGAGRTAMEFAKVGEMDVAQAAVVMSDAMNVFKVSSDVAANALSSAADASSTSIAQMSEAFSMSSAVAGKAGLSIEDLSATLAILANNGVKGSDAGTSVKTMLMRLMAPASEAADAMAGVGLSVRSFVNQDTGKMLPMVDIIGKLGEAMKPLDEVAKKELLAKIFGADAIRAALILGDVGVAGFEDIQKAMSSALPVGEKYKILMSGLAGSAGNVLAALQRMAIAVSDAVAPALASVVPFITGFIDGLTKLATDNKEAVAGFAKFAVAAIAVGSALTGLGISFQVTSFGFAGIGKAAAFALSPLTMLMGTVTGVGKSFALAMPATLKLAGTIGSSMLTSSASVLSFAATAGGAMAGFATSSATALAGFAASSAAGFVRMSGAASTAAQAMFPVFFTGFSRGIAAGAGFFSATLRGLNGVVMASSTLRSAMFAVSGSGMARFVGDIVGGLTLTYKSFVWWATGATARMAQYAANLTGAVGKTIASTAAMSAAWLGSAARGVAAFVGSAVAGIGSYLAATAMAVAGSVASAAAVAAAWLAPLAPLLLLSAAAVGVGVAVKQFGPQIAGAFSGLAGYASDAASAIGSGLNTAVSDGIVVFGDLAKTATTTFNGVYEAVAAGDLAGAMEVLWAGLVAGWLRGVEALMSYVDPWVAAFQDVFTDLGASIYVAWDSTWVNVSNAFNTFGALLQGAFDNTINGVLKSWDDLESGVLKSWNYIQSFFKEGFDLEAENNKVDSDMTARARDRELKRPGIAGRTAAADAKNAEATADLATRTQGVLGDAQATKDGRQTENAQRAADRRAATVAAEGALTSLVGGQAEMRAKSSTDSSQQIDPAALASEIASATTMDGLAKAGLKLDGLISGDKLTTEQEDALLAAYRDAQNGIANAEAVKRGSSDSNASMGTVAGTFSSINLSGQFGGSSLAERTAKAAEETAKNTRKIDDGGKVAE
jgi:TP901 family phage tail tape measure protein